MNLTHQHTAMIDVATLAQNKTIETCTFTPELFDHLYTDKF